VPFLPLFHPYLIMIAKSCCFLFENYKINIAILNSIENNEL